MAHITGGGIIENLPRMFADDSLAALIDLDSWQRPAVFGWLAQAGNVAETEMLRTFNCGVGFVLCVASADVAVAMKTLEDAGESPKVIGEIVAAGSASSPRPAAAERGLLVPRWANGSFWGRSGGGDHGRGNVTPRWPWYFPPRSLYVTSHASSPWKNNICATPSFA